MTAEWPDDLLWCVSNGASAMHHSEYQVSPDPDIQRRGELDALVLFALVRLEVAAIE
jgi:hypothetical protein